MDKYQKDGVIYNGGTIEYKGMTIHNPSVEMLVKAGWEVYVEPEVVDPTYTEEELAEMEANRQAEEARKAELKKQAEEDAQRATLTMELEGTTESFLIALEEYFIVNGSDALKEIAGQRKAIREERDAIGKVVQSAQGSGTMADPFKVWKEGMSVKANDWWMTQDGYLWMAIKDGVPASSTDKEYWDVVE